VSNSASPSTGGRRCPRRRGFVAKRILCNLRNPVCRDGRFGLVGPPLKSGN
jgi:hypothetical protein